MRLYKLLKQYSKKHIVAMHMPGHKRHNFLHNNLPYNLDITEIDGFDNLHNPTGILKDCFLKATNIYKTKKSFYLVNGSTCGILTAIKSVANIGDKIIIAQNCHKSVFNAIELLNLNFCFIKSHYEKNTNIFCDIKPEDIKEVLKNNPDAKCVLITSPTYEGVISNIKEIAKIVHSFNIPLIVDEAHGAHLYLSSNSAVNFGADIVINSLHKTLPSFTQTALLHICSNRINIDTIQKNLAIFESSSPSYILMASIDECLTFMSKNGEKYYKKLQKNLILLKKYAKKLNFLKIVNYNKDFDFYDFDKTKIVILTNETNINGEILMQKLREQKIELEMCYSNYALAMTTIFDTKKDILKLIKALIKIDSTLSYKKNVLPTLKNDTVLSCNIYSALKSEKTNIKFLDSIDKISAEYVYVYPPGIPLIVPGQKITKQNYDTIINLHNNNLSILSSNGNVPKEINIVKKLDKINKKQ